MGGRSPPLRHRHRRPLLRRWPLHLPRAPLVSLHHAPRLQPLLFARLPQGAADAPEGGGIDHHHRRRQPLRLRRLRRHRLRQTGVHIRRGGAALRRSCRRRVVRAARRDDAGNAVRDPRVRAAIPAPRRRHVQAGQCAAARLGFADGARLPSIAWARRGGRRLSPAPRRTPPRAPPPRRPRALASRDRLTHRVLARRRSRTSRSAR